MAMMVWWREALWRTEQSSHFCRGAESYVASRGLRYRECSSAINTEAYYLNEKPLPETLIAPEAGALRTCVVRSFVVTCTGDDMQITNETLRDILKVGELDDDTIAAIAAAEYGKVVRQDP